MIRSLVSISALAIILATSVVALKPLVGASQCSNGVKCCNSISASQPLTPVNAKAKRIFPPLGLLASECTPMDVTDEDSCSGVATCCPDLVPLIASRTSPSSPATTSSDCSLVDMDG